MLIKNFDQVTKQLQEHLVDYLEEKGIDTKKKFSCLDPKHEDKNPSCSIIPASNRAYCHSQGHLFDIFDAVRILENKPGHGPGYVTDVLLYLANKYGIEVEIGEISEEKAAEISTYRAYRAAAEYIARSNHKPSTLVKKEIERRGWQQAVLTDLMVGWIPSHEAFINHMISAGFDENFLEECDLVRNDLFNEDNIIFTTCDEHGHPVGFAARNMHYVKGDKNSGPKYVNQRHTGVKANIFQKGKRLFGFNLARETEGPVYIFEGQGDVITARQAGIHNCCAVGSTAMTTDHVLLLKECNKFNIILCLDPDDAGQNKIEKLLDTRFAGHRDMRVSIVLIPNGQDPDDFIRENGVEAFRALAKWSAFEWRLDRFTDTSDANEIVRAMIPFIVNEPSYINQEDMARTLANHTGYSLKTILAEVARLQNAQEERKQTERLSIIDRALHEAKENPIDAEIILTDAKNRLFEVNKKYDEDKMSEEACLKEIVNQRLEEEAKSDRFAGFELGPDLTNLQEALCGEWDRDVLLVFGGKANCGKTALFSKLAYSIASIEANDALAIVLSIDDTREQFLPRLVSVAEGSKQLTINQIKSPNFWAQTVPDLAQRRTFGYQKIESLVRAGRLVVKDQSHGTSLAYMETLIQYYKEKYPSRRMVFFLDNFHKLSDFHDQKDERVRFKQLSHNTKELAKAYHIPIVSTMEYTKLPPGTRPSNNNIAESVAMEYDSNLICHLYNELHDLGPAATNFHVVANQEGNGVKMPRIEMIFGKNKITSFKDSIFFDFFPAASDFRAVDQDVIAAEMEAKRVAAEANNRRNGRVNPNEGGLFDRR